jgi:alginate O-acetyltransferase complex protein AlgI
MAVGLACIFGFDFPANFRYPYIAESVTEFWRRWHMSLSRWFRDYLYIPLGGNRVSPVRTYVNLTTVFLLCGLWHGAALTFVFWGIYHGVFLAIERAFLGDRLTRLPRILRHLYLIVVILLGWVLFRSPSLHYAKGYLWAMLGLSHGNPQLYPVSLYLDAHSLTALLVGILGSTPIWLWLRRSSGIPYDEPEMLSVPVFHRRLGQLCLFAGLTTSLFLALLSVAGGTYDPFIYFRF